MGIRSRNKVSTAFNMSSMTDIVFLLLIFFIVISTLISPYGLNVILPKSAEKTTGKQNITITIKDDLTHYINGELTHPDAIEAALHQELGGASDAGVVLKADKSVDHGTVVTVMDIAYRNKYNLVLATKP